MEGSHVRRGVDAILVRDKLPDHIWLESAAIGGHAMNAFASRDGGRTFAAVLPPEGYESDPLAFAGAMVELHPTEAEWVLATAYRAHCRRTVFLDCPKDAFVSHDLGETWRNLTANGAAHGVLSFDKAFWGFTQLHHQRNAATGEQEDITRETILAMVRTHEADVRRPSGKWHAMSKFVSSDTEFSTEHTAHLECANAAFTKESSGTIYVGVHADCDQLVDDAERGTGVRGDEASLYISENLGLSFQKACYPIDLTEDRCVRAEPSRAAPPPRRR